MVAGLRSRVAPVGAGVLGLMLLVWGLLMSGQTAASALTNCNVADTSVDAQETQFVTLLNQYRAQNGLPGLTLSTNLTRASSWMAVDLAANNYFSHTDSTGRAPAIRTVDCGYPIGAGENIAGGVGWDTAQEALDAWKTSPGHNNNMLGSAWMQVGVARYYSASATYGWYWVTNFGSTNDGTGGAPAPTNTPTTVATNTVTATPTRTNTPAGQGPAATPTPFVPAPTAIPAQGAPQPTATPAGANPPAATPTPVVWPTATPSNAAQSSPTASGSQPTASAPSAPSATKTPTPAPTPTPTPATSNAKDAVPLKPGANLVTWPGGDLAPAEALGASGANIVAVYSYDATTGTWKRYAPGLPGFVNNLAKMKKGEAYWVIAKSPVSLLVER